MNTDTSEWLRLLGWAAVALALAGWAFAAAPWRTVEDADWSHSARSAGGECLTDSQISVIVCPAEDFEVGSCYHQESPTSYRRATCGSAYASVRVTQRIDFVSNSPHCGEDTYQIVTVLTPWTTFCLSRP